MATLRLIGWRGSEHEAVTVGFQYDVDHTKTTFTNDLGLQSCVALGDWGGNSPVAPAALVAVPKKSALDTQEGGDHYKTAIQPVQYIHANELPFIEGNVVKYISRWRNKNGLQDLRKAAHYIDLLIELEETKQKEKAA